MSRRLPVSGVCLSVSLVSVSGRTERNRLIQACWLQSSVGGRQRARRENLPGQLTAPATYADRLEAGLMLVQAEAGKPHWTAGLVLPLDSGAPALRGFLLYNGTDLHLCSILLVILSVLVLGKD